MQLAEVLHAALGEIDVRLHGHARRDGRMAHQVGVGCLLATDHHGRHAAADNGVDAVLPGPVAAEDPHHDEVGAVELLGRAHRRRAATGWPTGTALRWRGR